MPAEYLATHIDAERLKLLAAVTVGIVGAGGLGSNCALMLARSGIRKFIIMDGDIVELSNLNRQIYFPRHLGMLKVEALARMIAELDPEIVIEQRACWLTPENIGQIMPEADLWVEAVDNAPMKQTMVSEALKSGKFIVGASGLAGWGGEAMRKQIICGQNGKMRAALVGDARTAVTDKIPPMAPRTIQAAAMQADIVLEYILGAVV